MWALIYYKLLSIFIYKRYKRVLSQYIGILVLFFELLSIMNRDLVLFIMSNVLIFQSITDIINNDVYIYPNLLLIPLGFYRPVVSILSSTIIIPAVLLILSKITKGLRAGDINLLFCLGFIFDYEQMIYIVLVASILNLIYAFFARKNTYSFEPFISISSMLIYAIKP